MTDKAKYRFVPLKKKRNAHLKPDFFFEIAKRRLIRLIFSEANPENQQQPLRKDTLTKGRAGKLISAPAAIRAPG